MKNLFFFFKDKIRKDNIGAYAGQATLFFTMSIIPFMIILMFITRLTPVTEEMIVKGINMYVPGAVAPLFISMIDEVYNSIGSMIFLVIFLAAYSSAKTIQSLRYSLNIVYGIKETRNWFALRFKAMGETLLLMVAVGFLLVLIMFGHRLQKLIAVYIPLISFVYDFFYKIRIVVIFFVLIAVFTFIYKKLPNREATYRSQLVGAVSCSVAWYVFSIFVALYIKLFKGFSTYGSFTTLIILMFWLYFAFYIFLVCGEINAQLEIVLKELKIKRKLKKGQTFEERAQDVVEEQESRLDPKDRRKTSVYTVKHDGSGSHIVNVQSKEKVTETGRDRAESEADQVLDELYYNFEDDTEF